jgi:uncharacterized protein (DUF433 family)
VGSRETEFLIDCRQTELRSKKLGFSKRHDFICRIGTTGEVLMNRLRWQERVVIEADLHHGDPCIRGTRVPVTVIIGSLADGMTPGQVLRAYPQLTDDDISAALAYAAEVIKREILLPLAA